MRSIRSPSVSTASIRASVALPGHLTSARRSAPRTGPGSRRRARRPRPRSRPRPRRVVSGEVIVGLGFRYTISPTGDVSLSGWSETLDSAAADAGEALQVGWVDFEAGRFIEALGHFDAAVVAELGKAIEAHPDFYRCPVETSSRSYMNVVFRLPDEELEARFEVRIEIDFRCDS